MPNTLPQLHIQPLAGWLNDPNGIVRRDGRWHVFHQANPKAPVHADIEWGHVSSTDLVTWEHHPIAFRPMPGGPDAAGCWSGVFLPWLTRPAVAYSGLAPGDASTTVCVRESLDDELLRWTDPRVVATTPDEVQEMRDPFCFEWGGRRLAIVGGRLRTGEATVLLYDVADPNAWRYLGVLLHSGELDFEPPHADIWECPQLVIDGDRCWLIVSRWVAGETRDVIAFRGSITDHDGLPSVHITGIEQVDAGDTFYAPQVSVDAGDSPLLFGWIREPDQAAAAASGISGCLTLPRRVHTSGDQMRFVVEEALQRYADGAPAISVQLHSGTTEELPRLSRTRSAGALSVHLTGAHQDIEIGCPSGGFELWTDGEVIEVFPVGAPPVTLRDSGTEQWRISATVPVTLDVRELAPPPSPASPVVTGVVDEPAPR